MVKNENNKDSTLRRSFLLWVIVLLTFAISCRQDEIFMDADAEHQSELKQAPLSNGTYEGTYTIDGKEGEWLIALPEDWNSLETRYMVFYAHGIVDPVPYEEVQLPSDSIEGIPIEKIVTGMNMGYATTSYRDNGLVVLDAIDDIEKLVDIVNGFLDSNEYERPHYYFLGGPSEGGLVTVKTIEKNQYLFDGAISIGGPIGDFYKQLQYNGDFHVLFNYFFNNELSSLGIDLGSPEGVHPGIIDAWKYGSLQDIIKGILFTNPDKVIQLIKCANVTVDTNDDVAVGTAILELLRFNIMFTNDVLQRLDGKVPFDNTRRWYRGSDNDWRLNRKIERIRGETKVNDYETLGDIGIPLVTIHTTGDHVTPFWHNPRYRIKIFLNGNSLLHTGIPVVNYGHCTIEKSHIMAALAIIITKVTMMEQYEIAGNLFGSSQELDNFKKILNDHSIQVEVNK